MGSVSVRKHPGQLRLYPSQQTFTTEHRTYVRLPIILSRRTNSWSMTASREDLEFRVHDVLYIDFLGFADRVTSADERGLGSLVHLLERIADARQEFDVEGQPQPDGGYLVRMKPEITTFSDHVVASFPSEPNRGPVQEILWRVVRDGWVDSVHHQMQKITASLMLGALEIDLLVRGGLSCGALVHNQRVVIGKALIDAYRLESEVAGVARIAVSDDIELSGRVVIEGDGVRCLDYTTELMLLADERYRDARAWADDVIRRIDARLPGLTDKQAFKWRDFRGRLAHQRETWPGKLKNFGSSGCGTAWGRRARSVRIPTSFFPTQLVPKDVATARCGLDLQGGRHGYVSVRGAWKIEVVRLSADRSA